jgi:hypothetical protein
VTPRSPHAVDVRRRAGWLPDDQVDLESWITGHRERVDARGDDVELHPVLVEFQELIDTDPLVRRHAPDDFPGTDYQAVQQAAPRERAADAAPDQ